MLTFGDSEMPGASKKAHARFSYLVLEFWAPIWTPGDDISETFLVMIWSNDSQALLNYIFIRFLLIWPLLWHPFSEEFRKHTSLDFQRRSHTKALVLGCGAPLLCPFSSPFFPPHRRCTLVLFFLPFWDAEGNPFPSGLTFFSWIICWHSVYLIAARVFPQCSRP